MKTILFLITMSAVAAVGAGCSKKGASSGSCAGAVSKGVDTMMAAGQKRMESMPGGMPADIKAKMDEASAKLKTVIANRCTEDKWSAEIIDCYNKAATREDLKACRAKLPPEQASKLQSEEMQVMSQMMGGGPGRGMHGAGGPHMVGSPPPANPAAAEQHDEINRKNADAIKADADAQSVADRQAAQAALRDLRKQAAELHREPMQPSAH